MTGRGASLRWTESWAAPAVVAVAASAVFARNLFGAFVVDDFRFIAKNPNVQEQTPWLRLLTDAGTADPGSPHAIVRPMRTVEFAADRHLLGDAPWGFHLHSLLWHALAAVLLLLVLRRLLGDPRAALVGALFWAVHPVQAESVAWMSGRGDVAMGACSLAAVLFALKADGFDRNLAFSLAAMVLACLYKETGVALPFVVAALRWTRLARVPRFAWPYFVAAGAYLVYRQAVQVGPTGHGVAFQLGGSTAGTFATMTRGFGWYVVETLVPAQSFDWYMTPSTSFADAAVLAWLAVHAAIVGSAVACRVRAPLWTVAVAWFYAFLLPVLNWPYFISIPTAERFLYVPLGGVALALGWGLARVRGALAPALVAVAALGASAFVRAGIWSGEDALWSAVRADHESPRAEQHFGDRAQNEAVGPVRRERLEEALARYHRVIRLVRAFERTPATKSATAYVAEVEASNVCGRLGDRDPEAVLHAERAIAIEESAFPQPHYDRALPLLRLGFAPQAAASMRRAQELGLTKGPDVELARFYLDVGAACARDALFAEARRAFESAAAAAPPGVLADLTRARLAEVNGRPRPADAEERERRRLAELDADLARLPRVCPDAGD